MTLLALSASFEYLCYGSKPLFNINSFCAGTVFRRKDLISKDGPRAERLGVYRWIVFFRSQQVIPLLDQHTVL